MNHYNARGDAMLEVVNRRKAMHAVAVTAATLGCTTGIGAAETDRQSEDKAHCEWLARIIKQTERIKVGMTRGDVETILVADVGGFPNPKGMRYQHPRCPYIKMDLEFELATSDNRKDDKIVKRSMPLLDLIPNKARW
jgi:hypothetical protein